MTDITDRVMRALMEDPELNKADIDVSTNQSIVTITGTVKTAAARDRAEEIANSQPGVIKVINEIKVV
jgi:osmotically-inducible protein OsmY